MKIIDTYWEKRNLGRDSVEVILDYEDSCEELVNVITSLEQEYQVLKIPSGRTDLLLSAQTSGFQIIEMSIQLKKSIKNYELPMVYKRFEKSISFVKASEEQLKTVLEEINNNMLFNTDRIFLDPQFGEEFSGKRYYNWINDLVRNGSDLNIALYNDEVVGFAVNTTKDKEIFNAVFGGVMPKFANKGLGFLAIHTNIKSIIQQGGKRITTAVSSNNVPILRLHLLFGFEVQSMEYVLIKHTEVFNNDAR